jgi:hypothetical protein
MLTSPRRNVEQISCNRKPIYDSQILTADPPTPAVTARQVTRMDTDQKKPVKNEILGNSSWVPGFQILFSIRVIRS